MHQLTSFSKQKEEVRVPCHIFRYIMSSAEVVVQELLDRVLEEVCKRTEWDVTARMRQERTHIVRGPHFDLCTLVRLLYPSRVLTCFSLIRGRAEILQLRCVEQQASGYCGHYALYFTLCCLECCCTELLSDCKGFLTETSCVGGFWRRYWSSIGTLLEHVAEREEELWWPWTAEHVLKGDMERSYLSYILASDTHVQALQGDQKIVVLHVCDCMKLLDPCMGGSSTETSMRRVALSKCYAITVVTFLQYAYGCIQDTESQVCAMQQRITAFREAPPPAHLVFILGVTNHWITLLAYKSGPKEWTNTCRAVEEHDCEPENVVWESGREKVALLYLDSNNVPVLGASDADILAHMHKKEKERVQRKGKGYSEWKRGVIFQAFVDQRQLVWMLADCLCGKVDLRGELLGSSWCRVLDSYEQSVVAFLDSSEDSGLYVALLLQWLEAHYRPQTLKDTHVGMLCRLGPCWLGQRARERVKQWVEHCQSMLGCCSTGLVLVDLFASVVDQTATLVLHN